MNIDILTLFPESVDAMLNSAPIRSGLILRINRCRWMITHMAAVVAR